MLELGILGFILSLCVTTVAYYKKSLTMSGFMTATVIGTLFFMFGSYIVWSILIFFFISSSLLSKMSKNDREKDGRNYTQVIANSAVSLIFLALYYYLNDLVYLIVSVVAIAASTADTWASEIGSLSRGKTFSILNLKPMEKGLSGAVSLAGLTASLIGAFIVSLLFSALYFAGNNFAWILLMEFVGIITVAGFIGSILDSYLGVLLQAKYKEIKSGKIAEFIASTENYILISGKRFITNNAVNFIMVLTVSVVTYLLLVI
ncbi:MAG: DUF92 domain-containing protein [Acholeplasma sp.]